jgi:C-terminal processing protease CtpA/Prc
MNNHIDTASDTGRELFYAIWQKVLESFYDQEKLKSLDWAGKKHTFDEQIVDQTSALSCAKILLATLGDKYTKLLEPQEVVAKREGRVSETLYAYNKVLPGNIGYIGIASFDHSDIVEQVRERLEGVAHCDAFVVDVRGNGGGLINETANVCELFIDEGDICFIERRTPSGLNERFVSFSHEHFVVYMEETGKEPEKDLYLRRPAMIAGKPMVVLIDGGTASSAELFTAALVENGRKDGRIIAMGTRTCGKGIGQVDFDIRGITTLKMSITRFLSPSNKWFGDAGQSVANGIEPDICMADKDEPIYMVRIAARHLRAELRHNERAAESLKAKVA